MWQNILHNYSAFYTSIFARSAIEKIVGGRKEMYKRPHVPMKKKLTNRLNIVVDRKFTVFQTSHILHDIIGF